MLNKTVEKIPERYKKTEMGVIPEEWQIKKLGKLCGFTQGVQIPQSEQIKYNKEGYIRYLYVRDFFTDNFKWYVKNIYPDKIMKESDIMMVNTGNTAGTVYSGTEGVLSNNAFKISFNKREITNEYLFLFLKSAFTQNMIKNIFNTAGQPHVGHKNIAQVYIPLPSISEQTAISNVLSDTDALISSLEKLTAKKKKIKIATMQQLLTGKKRLPGFEEGKSCKKTEIGIIPEDWEVKKLGEIFKITRGQVLATGKMSKLKSSDYSYPVYSSQTSNNGLIGYFNNYLFKNAITWTTDGANAGDVKYRREKFYCTNVCGVLLSNEGFANHCVAEAFNRVSRKYVSYVGNPKLMNNVVKEILVLIPSKLEEQIRISNVITDMNNEINQLKQELTKYKMIKQSMMQELLTGKTRLV
jgi:type I restriction enzyme S subunit